MYQVLKGIEELFNTANSKVSGQFNKKEQEAIIASFSLFIPADMQEDFDIPAFRVFMEKQENDVTVAQIVGHMVEQLLRMK